MTVQIHLYVIKMSSIRWLLTLYISTIIVLIQNTEIDSVAAFQGQFDNARSRQGEYDLNMWCTDAVHIQRREVAIQHEDACPTFCICELSHVYNLVELAISCEFRTLNQTSLYDDIDKYLATVACNVTALVIQYTPLTSLPQSICRMEQLKVTAFAKTCETVPKNVQKITLLDFDKNA